MCLPINIGMPARVLVRKGGETSVPKLNHDETQRRLTEGLLALIADHPLYEVQVREVCAQAGVSRSTFYKHYEGMEGFIRAIEEQFVGQMNEAFSGTNVFLRSVSQDAHEIFARCTAFMHRHASFARPMIGPNGSPTLHRRIARLWTEQVHEALDLLKPLVRPDLDIEFFSSCVSAAMLTLLEVDLLHEGDYNADYVARQMSAIVHGCMLDAAMRGHARAQWHMAETHEAVASYQKERLAP